MRILALLVLGCGTVSHSPDSAPGGDGASGADSSGGSDGAGTPDATVPRCNPDAPFGAPAPLSALNGYEHEESARLSADELTVYYSGYVMGDWNLFTAERQAIEDPFVDPVLLPGVNTVDLMRHPTVTADGLFLYVSSYTYDYDTAWSQRASTMFNFAPLMLEPALDGAPGSHDYQPYVVPDHSALYFVRDPGAVGMADLYRASREGTSFAIPEVVGGVNGAAADLAPVISPDELTIYFASDRLGALDIFEARRADPSMPFDMPAPITELMTPEEETPGWISADGCVLYFSRFVLETQTDLFVARRGF